MEKLTHGTQGIDVCIAYSQKVKTLGDEAEYEHVIEQLNSLKPRPQVVVRSLF
jgi:hypothetical protein